MISYGRTLPLCVTAADELAESHGIRADVLDLRTIFPYDWQAISRSVMKTGRILLVNEDTEVTNFGEHLLRRVIDRPLLRSAGPATAVAGPTRARDRLESGLRTQYRSATDADSTSHARAGTGGGVAVQYLLPELGEGVYEAELVEWLGAVGKRCGTVTRWPK